MGTPETPQSKPLEAESRGGAMNRLFGNKTNAGGSGGGSGGDSGGSIFSAPDPKEQVKKWKADMRAEARKVDRQITKIQREELKVKQSIKAAAKRGDTGSAKVLAKEYVRSQKAVAQLHTSKAQMNSVVMQMTNQMSQKMMAGQMKKSTEIMASMNKLMKVTEISATMQQMSEEMMKAGLIDEMTQDAMEALDGEDDEHAADAMGGAASAGTRQLQTTAAAEEEEEDMES